MYIGSSQSLDLVHVMMSLMHGPRIAFCLFKSTFIFKSLEAIALCFLSRLGRTAQSDLEKSNEITLKAWPKSLCHYDIEFLIENQRIQ
jgi:hypothetical protein